MGAWLPSEAHLPKTNEQAGGLPQSLTFLVAWSAKTVLALAAPLPARPSSGDMLFRETGSLILI